MEEDKSKGLLIALLKTLVDVPENPSDEDLAEASTAFGEKITALSPTGDKKEDKEMATGLSSLATLVTESTKGLKVPAKAKAEKNAASSDVMVALASFQKQIAALSSTASTTEKKEEEKKDATSAELVTALSSLTTIVSGLVSRQDEQERAAIEAKALAQGKIIPLSAKGLDLPIYRKIVDELPANQVPVNRRTPEGVAALSSIMANAEDAETKQIREKMGISREDWEKAEKR